MTLKLTPVCLLLIVMPFGKTEGGFLIGLIGLAACLGLRGGLRRRFTAGSADGS